MRRFSILQAIPLSFFSRDLYRDVVRSWRGAGIAYLLLIVTLLALVTVFRMQVSLAKWTNGTGQGLASRMPRLVIRHRVVEFDRPMPYMLNDPTTGKTIAIVDTTGQITALDSLEATLLLTRDHVIYRKSAAETRVFDLTSVKDFTVDSTRLTHWLRLVSTWAAPVALPFVLLCFFVFRLVQQLLLAAIALLVGPLAGARLDFSASMRLAAVALTPALILEPLFEFLGGKPPLWGLLWFGIVLGYLVWALRANAAGAASVPGTSDPAPPPAQA